MTGKSMLGFQVCCVLSGRSMTRREAHSATFLKIPDRTSPWFCFRFLCSNALYVMTRSARLSIPAKGFMNIMMRMLLVAPYNGTQLDTGSVGLKLTLPSLCSMYTTMFMIAYVRRKKTVRIGAIASRFAESRRNIMNAAVMNAALRGSPPTLFERKEVKGSTLLSAIVAKRRGVATAVVNAELNVAARIPARTRLGSNA